MTFTTDDLAAPSGAAQAGIGAGPTAPRRRGRLHRWVHTGGLSTLLFALPIVVVFGYFSWGPIVRGLVLAFQRTNLVTPSTWVGFDNFSRVFSDPLLGTATVNTIWFAFLAALIGFPVPILLAVHVAELRRNRALASVLAYLPGIIPPVVSVLLWKEFFQPDKTGVFNTVLGWLGIAPLPWLQSGTSAMPSIVIQATWAGFGSTAIIYLAALMSINAELYDAAEIDGAGILRRTWHITLPEIRGVMVLMLLLQLIGTLQVFTEPFLMTDGGPNNRTVTLLMLIYRYAFIYGDFGGATALSVLLALGLGVISVIYFRLTRRWDKA